MKSILISLALILMLTLASCNRKSDDQWTVTDRIQYDVTIKSPDLNLEWWVQNIEGRNRETFLLQLLDAASNGKIKTYDAYSYRAFSDAEVKNIISRTDTLRFQRSTPPYNLYDTVLHKSLSIYHITRIRFMEEWRVNNKSQQVNKKVLGIAPLSESYDAEGNLRGFMPLFWIFFDEKYPGILKR